MGELGSIPSFGRSPGEGKGCPLQYSDLENSMDCIVHGVAKSRTMTVKIQQYRYIYIVYIYIYILINTDGMNEVLLLFTGVLEATFFQLHFFYYPLLSCSLSSYAFSLAYKMSKL